MSDHPVSGLGHHGFAACGFDRRQEARRPSAREDVALLGEQLARSTGRRCRLGEVARRELDLRQAEPPEGTLLEPVGRVKLFDATARVIHGRGVVAVERGDASPRTSNAAADSTSSIGMADANSRTMSPAASASFAWSSSSPTRIPCSGPPADRQRAVGVDIRRGPRR